MKLIQPYEKYAIISLKLRNFKNKEKSLSDVILDTGYEDQLILKTSIFFDLELHEWTSRRGRNIMREDPAVIYGGAKINIPGLFSGYWKIDVAAYPHDEELREVNLLGLGILEKMCAAFNALASPKQLILKTIMNKGGDIYGGRNYKNYHI